MSEHYALPQDAEDAFYDALEAGDLERLMGVWDSSEDSACLLPMQALVRGPLAIREIFARLFKHQSGVELSVRHLHWIESSDLAVHLVEETPLATDPQGPPPGPIYGTNIFRRTPQGWRLVLHQNAPLPPPPDMRPPLEL